MSFMPRLAPCGTKYEPHDWHDAQGIVLPQAPATPALLVAQHAEQVPDELDAALAVLKSTPTGRAYLQGLINTSQEERAATFQQDPQQPADATNVTAQGQAPVDATPTPATTAVESIEYTDGTKATGVAPLPKQSPKQQRAAKQPPAKKKAVGKKAR